jgi:hypothetical protein
VVPSSCGREEPGDPSPLQRQAAVTIRVIHATIVRVASPWQARNLLSKIKLKSFYLDGTTKRSRATVRATTAVQSIERARSRPSLVLKVASHAYAATVIDQVCALCDVPASGRCLPEYPRRIQSRDLQAMVSFAADGSDLIQQTGLQYRDGSVGCRSPDTNNEVQVALLRVMQTSGVDCVSECGANSQHDATAK